MNFPPRLVAACIPILLAVGVVALAGCRGRQAPGGGGARGPSAQVCPIDGMPISSDALSRRPLAVMIENSPSARPQSGLDRACVVYEAITEGGITRFLAVYLHDDPPIIGPVRSARPHFIRIAQEYDAALVHCGESNEALRMLAYAPSIYDLDEMKCGAPFRRDRSRRAPHNLYASGEKLRAFMAAQRWEAAPEQMPRFIGEGKLRYPLPAQRVSISFGGPARYQLEFVYHPEAGGYVRYMDGKLHVDRQTGKPLVAANIIIQRVWSQPFENSEFETQDVKVVGRGAGYFVTGGVYVEMRWEKWRDTDVTAYTNESGKPLPFTPGQTWVELVPIEGRVTLVATDAAKT